MRLREAAADSLTPTSEITTILDRNDAGGPSIEAGSLPLSDKEIYFFFSLSDCSLGPVHDVAFATATSVHGPYTKASRPLLVTGDGRHLVAPRGADKLEAADIKHAGLASYSATELKKPSGR